MLGICRTDFRKNDFFSKKKVVFENFPRNFRDFCKIQHPPPGGAPIGKSLETSSRSHRLPLKSSRPGVCTRLRCPRGACGASTNPANKFTVHPGCFRTVAEATGSKKCQKMMKIHRIAPKSEQLPIVNPYQPGTLL